VAANHITLDREEQMYLQQLQAMKNFNMQPMGMKSFKPIQVGSGPATPDTPNPLLLLLEGVEP